MSSTKSGVGFVTGLFLLSLVAPLGAAQAGLNLKSVGEIFVDAEGKAEGQNVAASILEAQGALQAYTSLALGAEIFSEVSIDGWSQVHKIEGVGSSSIVLRGSNAVVTIHDNINSEVQIQATKSTDVAFKLAAGASAELSAGSEHEASVSGSGGAHLGDMIIVDADGAASGNSYFSASANGQLSAHLDGGSQVVFRADPVYVEAEAYTDAVVSALVDGFLAAEVITEFEGSASVQSSVEYFADTWTETTIHADNRVETRVSAQGDAGAMVAYDLAYETLAVSNADDVAVYADGKLAARADSAAEVEASAEAGTAAYFAATANGRTQVLASTPGFSASAQHSLAITATAGASAQLQAQAQAQARAAFEARAEGSFNVYLGGKVAGQFSSSVVASAQAGIQSHVNLETKTEVFTSAEVRADAWTQVQTESRAELRFEGQKTSLTLHDDAYATLMLEAKTAAQADFSLGADVRAYAESSTMAHLESSATGYAGTMLIVNADGSAAADSQLTVESGSSVHAELSSGARLIVQSGAEARAFASAEVVAHAVAEGKLGAQVVAGVQGSAVVTSENNFYAGVQADVEAAARGDFTVDFSSEVSGAASFVFDARSSAALSAKTSADIQVYVDGQAAARVQSAGAALNAEGHAAFHAEVAAQGQVRVVVNTGLEAGASADVRIVSRLSADAKANAKADAFGSFKLYYDGSAVGSYVSLKTDVEAGVITDFALAASGEVFADIKAGASAFVSAGAEGSAVLHLENNEASLDISDTTTAHMRVVAKADTTAEFRLAGDVTAHATSQTIVDLAAEGYAASMIITSVEGKASADSYFEITADGSVVAHLEAGAQVVFKSHVGIETELSAQQRTMINAAIATGKVGGQVFVQTQASVSAAAKAAAQASARAQASAEASAEAAAEARAALVAAAQAEGSVTTSITASYYNDVQLVTAATKSRVDVTVSSTVSAGKTIIVSLDKATISGMAQGNAEILVDGQAAVQASSYADILNPSDDGGASEYFVLAGEAGTQVLVSIPHFSTRVVTLRATPVEGPSAFMYATVFLGALIAAETVYLIRRRN